MWQPTGTLSTVRTKRYCGLYGGAKAWVLANLANEAPCITVVCKDRRCAEELLSDIAFFCPNRRILNYPAWDTLPLEPVSPQTYISAERLFTLRTLQTSRSHICITSIDAVCQRVLPPELIEELCFKLIVGKDFPQRNLANLLNSAGYQRVSLVEETGQYAIRGGVIDLAPAGYPQPVRIEFYGDTIERIKTFDYDSQRSFEETGDVEVIPVREAILFKSSALFESKLAFASAKLKQRCFELELPLRETQALVEALEQDLILPGSELVCATALSPLASFFYFLSSDHLIVLDDEIKLSQSLDLIFETIAARETQLQQEQIFVPRITDLYIEPNDIRQNFCKFRCSFFDSIELYELEEDNKSETVNIRSISNTELSTRLKTKIGTGNALQPLAIQIKLWRTSGWQIAFVVGSKQRARRLQKLLLDIDISTKITDESGYAWASGSRRSPVVILQGHISSGFQLPTENLVFISENELFAERSYRSRTRPVKSLKRILSSLAQLKENDFVVHNNYGIGIYRGLKHLTVEGVASDFLQIDYSDSKLFLPIINISHIQKFAAAEGQQPSIDRLGSNRWLKTKERVKESVLALAGDLIKLYAARSVAPGWRFEPKGAEDDRFADGFPFDETEDQLAAIDATLADMASAKPTDRLICGDVGFGKTEIALRAAYKCTQHARQVVVLAPTTILVEQHKDTFTNRFLGYPVEIRAVSRFYPPSENKKSLQELAEGKVDIIIGTHRLLQKDVAFADLGLLIIDEEHRFGVKQKERLKQFRRNVDVLTLTATPIPRTLHMALLDIKDISVISTPPHDRKIIRTYVSTFNDALIRDAIQRELQRGGQCFYVHNRIDSIGLLTQKLSELVPGARFAYGHGQMSEDQLEKIMRSFLQGDIDVLVCTTIIESGLDIPNANTIIIERADTFGLAQLYQLRGRVGRSKQQAYAYLIIPERQKLGHDAQRRLKALQALDDLGLGFNLAIRDLEIRGAGNLLGREQSGNVLAVGFELYTKILKEAVLNLKGSELDLEEQIDPEIKINVDAFIPEIYIPDISERLVIYQRLAAIGSEQEAFSVIEEIEDRFGSLPPETQQLTEVMRFRAALRHYGVTKAEFSEKQTVLSFSQRAPIDGNKILALIKSSNNMLRFKKNHVLSITPQVNKNNQNPIERFEDILNILEQIA